MAIRTSPCRRNEGASSDAGEFWPGTRVGAYCIRPIRRPPTGPNKYVRVPVPVGTSVGRMQFAPTRVPGQTSLPRQRPPLHGRREMTLAAGSKSVFGAILGGFWASKRVFGAIPAGFGAPNRFLAQSSPGLGLQIGFWRNPRRVWGSKSVFDAILGGFGASNRFLAQSSAGLGLQIGFWPNPRRVLGPRVRVAGSE